MRKVIINIENPLVGLVFGILWVTGWVLANGFWSTLFSVICPPWGWYLVAVTFLAHWGVI